MCAHVYLGPQPLALEIPPAAWSAWSWHLTWAGLAHTQRDPPGLVSGMPVPHSVMAGIAGMRAVYDVADIMQQLSSKLILSHGCLS